MRVMVTGGAGFIGSHIVDELIRRSHEPYVIDNLSTGNERNLPRDVRLFRADIRDADAVAAAFAEIQPQLVCHQAAQMSVSRSVREPAFDADVNVVGLLNVLEQSARVEAQRFVFASSGGVLYGDVFEPVDENYPAAPESPYGIAKWTGEQYLRFFNRQHGMQTVALRYANVYGPRQNPHGEAGVVAIFSLKMLAGEQATINGDGRYVRDYVYGPDVARANVLALEGKLDGEFAALNIGSGIGTDVNELAEHVRRLAEESRRSAGHSGEVPAPQHGPPRTGDLRSNLVSASRARKLLGWSPETSLDQGLQQTVEWFARQIAS